MGIAKTHPVPDRAKPSFVIFDIRALWRSGLSVRVLGCQKLQNVLTRSGAGCFIAVSIWQQWASEAYCRTTAEVYYIYNATAV